MNVLSRSWRTLATCIGAVLVISGCQENLSGGAACPALCPDALTIRDTVLVGKEAFDTAVTVFGVPPLGAEPDLLLADVRQDGNRLLSVAVLRFDSLARAIIDTTRPPQPFDRVESPSVNINLIPVAAGMDSVLVQDTTVTFLVYDVDANAPDLDTASVHARFVNTTPIASRTVPRDSLTGTIGIPLDTGFVGAHVRAGTRIRLGVRVESPGNVQVRIGSIDGNNPSTLRYTGFSGASSLVTSSNVNTRASSGPALPSLADYELPLEGTPRAPDGTLAAGGIPSSRIFVRFDLPAALVDSTTTVVRANLELHQEGNSLFARSDTITLVTHVVRATPAVTDITKASMLATDPAALSAQYRVPPLLISPTATRVDTIPLVNLFGLWRLEGRGTTQRAIVLMSSQEGFDPRQYFFHSMAAADSLRPRLRISYIPRSGFGLP